MPHFTYSHLPAKGLGDRLTRRPYVTGGVGLSFVFVFDSGLRIRVMTVENPSDIETETPYEYTLV